MKLSRYFGDRNFCLTALTVALPIMAQNLLTTSFSLVDTLMISSLGTAELTAVGTNSLAANAMLKAGAPRAATGENAVVVNCRHADVIVGPIGIVIADALLGEITPAMAAAVCQSGAKRVLVPINHCENYVVGVPDQPVSQLVAAAAQKVKELCSGKSC